MPAPAPSSLEVYNNLISLLSPSTAKVFELDILPSYFPAEIHSTSSAIALPKPLLASLFLTARHVFFSYLNKSSSRREQQKLILSSTLTSAPADAADDAALQATKIVLLWDPNHLTAANFRKKNLLSFSRSSSDFVQHLTAELSFLSSLLTSPLPKHTKSPTLWSHRFFLFQKFGHEISSSLAAAAAAATALPDSSSVSGPTRTIAIKNSNDNDNDIERITPACDKSLHLLWLHELEIIMKAGDRHPKNYYAWSYARQLLTALFAGEILPSPNTVATPAAPQIRKHQIDTTRMNRIAAASIPPMQKWCLAHPRDISGWAFLEYLLTTGLGWKREGRAAERIKCDEGGGLEKRGKGRLGNGAGEDVDSMVRKVVNESEEFVRKFQWQGDSLAWFLKAMSAINRESKEG